MTPKITSEMRAALARNPGQPIEIEDDQTHEVYLLVDAEHGRELTEKWLREQLQIGLDAAARGDVVEFNPEAIKRDGQAKLDAAD